MSGKTCGECFHWLQEHQVCGRDGCVRSGQHTEEQTHACRGFRDKEGEQAVLPFGPDDMEKVMAIIPLAKVPALHENVEQMGRYLQQMGQMMGAMQQRLDDLEARQAKVTISHADVKRIQGLIRCRADELCRKYNLQDKDSQKIFRAAIRKDALRRYQVKDLHDVPAAGLAGLENMIGSWVNIRMAMERRVST